MNKHTLKRLMILGCVSGVLSCFSFAGAMNEKKDNSTQSSGKEESEFGEKFDKEMLSSFLCKEERVLDRFLESKNKEANYSKVDRAMGILFDSSLYLCHSAGRLYKAFKIFRDMSSDERKDFIVRVIRHGKDSQDNEEEKNDAWWQRKLPDNIDDWAFYSCDAWKNSEFRLLNNNHPKLYAKNEKYYGLLRDGYTPRERFGGYRCSEILAGKGKNKRMGFMSITSTLDLWPYYEPNDANNKIIVNTDISHNHGKILIGTKYDLMVDYDKRNNRWAIDIGKCNLAG